MTIAKREFGKNKNAQDEVIAAWRKGIFTALPAKGRDGCRLLKAYVATANGPRRTLFLLQDASGDTVFLMHRPKGDGVGDNMSYKNPRFVAALNQSLAMALSDIENGAVTVIDRS
jgi:hypothetical protein